MSNNKGFTLVETLFVLVIIVILSLLTMNIYIPVKSDQDIIEEVTQILYQAKANSILYKEKTDIYFQKQSLKIQSKHYCNSYILTHQTSFSNYHFSYNEFGNIKTAKTVGFQGHHQKYSFIFQVGSGTFYVQ